MDDIGLIGVVGAWSAAALRSALPLMLVLLGETLTQRVGVINLGVEGQMLVGACFGFAAAQYYGDPAIALALGALAGVALSCVHAGLCLWRHANQIASGVAVMILGLGITSYFGRSFVGGQIQGLPPLAPAAWADVPLIGPVLTQLSAMLPITVALVILCGLWLYRTRTGLLWRAVGEHPEAALAAGAKPTLIKLQGILIGGALSGLGGAVLSVDYTQTWAQEMTKGRGLIAVGLVIVARWNPFLVLPVALLFGTAEAATLRLQAAAVDVSSYLLGTLPYVLCLVVLIAVHTLASRDSSMPAALRSVFRGNE